MSDLRCPHVGCDGAVRPLSFGFERDTFGCSLGHSFDLDISEPAAQARE